MAGFDEQTINYYSGSAASLASGYESAPPDPLLPQVIPKGSTVLDIGCGSARDLAVLHSLGVIVTGIEPSAGLLDEARRLHPEIAGRLRSGSLPDDMPHLPDAPFDTVLLSAVMMHLPDAALFDSALAVRNLLKTGGRLIISVPLERDDVDPETQRTADGRLMILRPVSRIRLLFERLGFELTSRWESADRLGRSGVSWVTLQFTSSSAGISRPVEMIERIINRDTKTATYKLALLRSCCDIAEKENGRVAWRKDGRVAIPADVVAEKWIEYYWPLLAPPRFLAQTQGEKPGFAKPVAFRNALGTFSANFRASGGLAAYMSDRDCGSLTPDAAKSRRALLTQVRNTIVKGPVYYSGGGSSDDKPFAYESSSNSILISADLWREFALLGFWIRDSLLIRWAEESRRMSGGEWQVSEVLDLLLTGPDPDRNVTAARNLYAGLNPLECVWTGASIRSSGPSALAVDHAIPWSLWRDNSLWNLLPATQKANSAKSDRLPTLGLIRRREESIVGCWQIAHQAHTGRFQYEATGMIGVAPEKQGRTAAARRGTIPTVNWEKLLLNAFCEAVETTAIRRGSDRWDA